MSLALYFMGADSPLTWQQLTLALCHLLQPQNTARIDIATTVAATGLLAWLIKTLGRWSREAYQLFTPTSLQAEPSQLARSCNYQQSP